MAQEQKPNLLIQIHDLINEAFDLEEFRELCLHLEVKYDNLRGETLSARIHDLVQQQKRQGKLDNLLHWCGHLRPNIEWPKPAAPVASNPTLAPVTVPQPKPHQIPVWGWAVAVVVLSSLLLGGVWALLPDSGGENEGNATATSALIAAAESDTPTPTVTRTAAPEPTNTRQPTSAPTDEPTVPPTHAAIPTPTAPPTPDIGSTRIRLTDEAVMVFVPVGEFMMGNDDGKADEYPLHPVYFVGCYSAFGETTKDDDYNR